MSGQPKDVWVGLSNGVALQMMWREALQMMRPSECMWPGRTGRRAGTRRRRVNIDSTQPERGRGREKCLFIAAVPIKAVTAPPTFRVGRPGGEMPVEDMC